MRAADLNRHPTIAYQSQRQEGQCCNPGCLKGKVDSSPSGQRLNLRGKLIITSIRRTGENQIRCPHVFRTVQTILTQVDRDDLADTSQARTLDNR